MNEIDANSEKNRSYFSRVVGFTLDFPLTCDIFSHIVVEYPFQECR